MSSTVTRDAVAVVTGAGSGIGRAIARELARRGGQVVCADIDLNRAVETVELIVRDGGAAVAERCDVGLLEDVEALASATVDHFGRSPSVVVNNAGIGMGGRAVGELPIEDWRRTVDVNLWGVVHGCHVFTPRLRDAGTGGILNVASAASFGSAAGMAPYNVTKAGVVSLSETLAAELAGTGIRVSVLCPTFVRTNIVEDASVDAGTRRVAARIMRLTGRSADRVARIALDGLDHRRLYVLPQVEAKLVWRLKRIAPRAHLAGAGALRRLGMGSRAPEGMS